MSRIKDRSLSATATTALPWLDRNIPITQQIAQKLSPEVFRERTICLNIHLDLKMIPVVSALVNAGARLTVLGANPQTTRDEVAAAMVERGAELYAWAGMEESDHQRAIASALERDSEFICEMGGDLTAAAVAGSVGHKHTLKTAMEATGTGIVRLRQLRLPIPVFNWDDLEIKQGLHNRYLVGLMVWNTYFNVTHLTLYGRRVLVVGYGLVGQGIAQYARLLGAQVQVCDMNPVRQLTAIHDGCATVTLTEGLRISDIVITATGQERVIGSREFPCLRDRTVLANAGHSNLEIDVPALRRHRTTVLGPGLEEVEVEDRRLYLLAGGAMLNLAAGPGDPYDAFDVTSALMLAGIEFMVEHYADYPPGIHLLPAEVEHRIAELATRSYSQFGS
jgi:adenosylhomocysteinase